MKKLSLNLARARKGAVDLPSLIIGIAVAALLTIGAIQYFGNPLGSASDSSITNSVDTMYTSIQNCTNKEATKSIPWTNGTENDQFGITIAKTPAYYTQWANNCVKGSYKITGTIAVDDATTSSPTGNTASHVLGGAQFDTVYGTTPAGVVNSSSDGVFLLVLYFGGDYTNDLYSDIASLGDTTALPSQPLNYSVVYKAKFDPTTEPDRDIVLQTRKIGGKAGTDSTGTAISTLAGKSGGYTNGTPSTGGKGILIYGKGNFDGAY